MITGHFGVAAAVKAAEQRTPLWALMLATVWLDVLFVPLLLTGIEYMEDVPGTVGGYGESYIYADYTHSLIGALLIAVLTGWVAMHWWGRRSGLVIGAVVFSHWLLDLVVHRPDMPVLPGNLGDLPRMGLGLWKLGEVALLVEVALLLIGMALYWRATRRARMSEGKPGFVVGLMGACGAVTVALDLAGI
ncbi:hypothetical protein [Kineosporia babensis]|uniref:Permease n=1 Tax=Kineosporia babensis TaxID=499548 RepID=A0A9X1NLB5_9ACTN|nr:hypothetical protein [Kineosporia babensis]MCD5316425.1 hypothetical protein [Kineosporia babensis]